MGEAEALGRDLAATAAAGGTLTPSRLAFIRAAVERLHGEILLSLCGPVYFLNVHVFAWLPRGW